MSDYRGVLYDRIPAQTQFYLDNYERSAIENNDFRLTINGRRVTDMQRKEQI